MSLSKTLAFVVISLVTIQFQAQVSANFGAAKFTPPDGKKLLIIGQDLGAVGGLDTHSNGYVDSFTNHIPAGVTSYTTLPNLDGLMYLNNWGAGDIHAEAYFEDTTFSNSFVVIGLYLVGVLDDINSGKIDGDIQTLANWVKQKNRPVFIRIGYEFDGSWNDYDPTEFKNAWKHIVHIFDAENVKNAAYVWQSSGFNNNNIANWYPGDDYVNWVGYSDFDGENMGQSIRDFAQAHNKPIMIAEATPKVDLKAGKPENHWANWYEPLFNDIYASDRIKALAYINTDWDSQYMWAGKGWGDSRVQEVPYIKEKWEMEINKSPWITADKNTLDTINYFDWVALDDEQSNGDVKKPELIIRKKKDKLKISNTYDEIMDELLVLDFFGRTLYHDKTPKPQYNIETVLLHQIPIFIIAKYKGNALLKKLFVSR